MPDENKEQPQQTPPKTVTITYPDGTTAQKVVDMLVRKRPLGWSRNSYATYYNENHAVQVRRELDSMIETKHDKLFRVENMKGMKINTIYLWINQAFRYIIDYYDGPEQGNGKYEKLFNEIKIKKEEGIGVSIRFRDFKAYELRGEDFVIDNDKTLWRNKIDEYLNSDDCKPFTMGKLLLSSEEVSQLKAELDGLEGIQYSVTNREVKIIKLV